MISHVRGRTIRTLTIDRKPPGKEIKCDTHVKLKTLKVISTSDIWQKRREIRHVKGNLPPFFLIKPFFNTLEASLNQLADRFKSVCSKSEAADRQRGTELCLTVAAAWAAWLTCC